MSRKRIRVRKGRGRRRGGVLFCKSIDHGSRGKKKKEDDEVYCRRIARCSRRGKKILKKRRRMRLTR